MMEKVNMSPVIMEKIMVTKGPVSLMALKILIRLKVLCKTDLVNYPAKNIR